MLADKPIADLISATADALTEPLNQLSVKQEIPNDLKQALRNNCFVFSGFKTAAEIEEASQLLKDSDGGFKPFQRYLNDVRQIDETYNRNYLRAEYNYATSSTQMAVNWKQWEADGDRYWLQYRTANDGRVREEHAALNGTTLPPSDPFWEKYLPPNGWNCRCTTVQVLKDKYPQSDPERAMQLGDDCTAQPKQRMFRFNPGKQMKVFPPKHPYLPKGCGNCGRTLLAYNANSEQCRACKAIKVVIKKNNKQFQKNYADYIKYKADEDYMVGDFTTTGGFLAQHKTRIPTAKTSPNEKAKYSKEIAMCDVLANNGYATIYKADAPGEFDVFVNREAADLKQTRSHNNIDKYTKKAVEKQGAKYAIFCFEVKTAQIIRYINNQWGLHGYKCIYYFKGENIIYKNWE